MNYQKLQRVTLIAWLIVLGLCLLVIGGQVLTQFAGRTVTGPAVSKSVWQPPYADWPHTDCTIAANGRQYTVPNSMLDCYIGGTYTIKVDPLDSRRAQFDGGILDNGTSPAWYFMGISLIFVLGGLLLRTAHVNGPWRTSLNWLLDKLQGGH